MKYQYPDGSSAEVVRLDGKLIYRRYDSINNFIDERPATEWETEMVASEERQAKIKQTKNQALAAIKSNKRNLPWGAILYNLAVAQGLIELE